MRPEETPAEAMSPDEMPARQRQDHSDHAQGLSWSLLLVVIGGAVGTAARVLITEAASPRLSGANSILMINVVGSLLLGGLVGCLGRRGADAEGGDQAGRLRRFRLLLGTGVLGGFTTYSTFALDTVIMIESGDRLGAVSYFLITVVAGVVAAGLGLWLARGPSQRTDSL